MARESLDADSEVSEAGHDTRRVAGANARGVFAVGDIADVVEFVLNSLCCRTWPAICGLSARSVVRLVTPRTATELHFPLLVSVT